MSDAHPLPHDSLPRHLAGAAHEKAVDSADRVEVTVVIRRRPLDDDHAVRLKARHNASALPHERAPLTRRELGVLHGAAAEDVGALAAFADRYGLEVVHTSPPRRDVTLAGTARAMQRAFGVTLRHFAHRGGSYRSHLEPVTVPPAIAGVVTAVLGLDGTPMFRRPAPTPAPTGPTLHAVTDIARAYRVPEGTGRGQRIALLSFGGGYHAADLRRFFAKTGRGAPRVRSRQILDARNAPSGMTQLRDRQPLDDRLMATVEATMDIQIAGAVAPGASIEMIFAPNDARGYRAAILAALELHPGAKRRRAADVIAISWGASEAEWAPHALESINAALEHAHDMGVTVCCASGDHGSRGTDRPARLARVDFPASSPFALACGGTTLRLAANGTIAGEDAWNSSGMATGGGISGYFARPTWQHGISAGDDPVSGVWVSPERPASFVGRGVPDVAANADPITGYEIMIGGRALAGCGTSAAAPFWAGLIAVLAERLGRPVGAMAALLYQPECRAALRDILHGDNRMAGSAIRYFQAHRGWNACTGLGSPQGDRLLAALSAQGRQATSRRR